MTDGSNNGNGTGTASGGAPSVLITAPQLSGRDARSPAAEAEPSLLALLARGLGWLGGMRDGLLVGASGLYLLGYVVRSLYAAQNNLGWLPALDAQYFVAGLGPALIFAGVVFAVALTQAVSGKVIARFLRGKWRCNGLLAVLGTGLLCAEAIRIYRFLSHLRPTEPWGVAVGALVAWAVCVQALLLLLAALVTLGQNLSARRAPSAKGSGLLNLFLSSANSLTSAYNHGYIPVLVGAFVLTLFLRFVYPQFPQEFGGARPRAAYLAVERAQLPAELARRLLPSQAAHSQGKIVETTEVEVFSARGDSLLVKLRPPKVGPGQAPPDNRTFEIKAGLVKAIVWSP